MRLVVADVMSREPVTVESNWPVGRAFELAGERGLRRLPVLEDGRLVGIITDRDFRILQTLPGAASFARRYQEFLLRTMPVREAMTPDPHTVAPGTDLVEAARMLMDLDVGGLPVVQDGELVGILSVTDLVSQLVELLAGGE